jgi:hypothetical protein
MLTPRPASVIGVFPMGREPLDHRKGVIEPTGHIQAIDIAVPDAGIYSVDQKVILGLYFPME